MRRQDDRQGWIDRIDRRLGRIWSRTLGTLVLAVGIGALVSLTASEGYALATHWPGLLIAGGFVTVGIALIRSRAPLSQTLDETPPKRRRD